MANGINGNGVNSLWKYVATVAVTVLIAGSPGMLYAVRTWSLTEEVRLIRDRQDDVRTRLAIIEQQFRAEHEQLIALEMQLRDLQRR